MKRLQLLAMAMMLCMAAMAQRVPLRIISQAPVEGVEEARSLIFDRYGLMWVGTDQGVRSYDGYRFRAYRSDAYTPGILPNNYVNEMTVDQNDGLWIGTRDGLVRYDRRRGMFRTYHLRGEQARTINALFTSADGTVWAGTNSGVARYDAEKDDFIDINMSEGVRALAEDKAGNIYIGTWEAGLFRLDRKSGRLVAYPRLSVRNTAQSLLMDSQGRLWVGTWENGIVRLDRPADESDPGIHRVNDDRPDFRTFHHLVEDPVSHSVWGCCIEGLTQVDLDDMTQVANHGDLSFCYDIETDGRGNLWVLTRNNGIVHLTTKSSPFSFCHLDPTGQVLPLNRIQSVFTSDGNLFWLGMQPYGLALYNRQSGQVVYNEHIPGFARMTGVSGIHAQSVTAMMAYGEGEIWMASTRGILIWKAGEEVRLLPRGGIPFIEDGNVTALYKLRSGIVLVGQNTGIGVVLGEAKGHMLKMSEAGRDYSICNVQAIMEDSRQQLWVATENAGIIRISGDIRHPETLRFRQYAAAQGNYPIDEATACYEDAAHRLWAITSNGGLFLYDAEQDRFKIMNHRFHLRITSLYAIEGDDKGCLWLSTDQGLVRLKVGGEGESTTAYYGREDGIGDIRFSSNGMMRYAKELVIGCADGFFSFEPDQVDSWQPKKPSPLIITELLIDDRPISWRDSSAQREIVSCQPLFMREITIPSDVKKFSVEFSLLTYQNQQQCKYFYQLEGYDSKWQYADAASRQATYQNLPAGTYTLRLRASDSYGHQVELPYTIRVRVLPPWYQSWWAYLIYICLLAAAVYGISQWYKNRVKRRARLQQRVNELIHYREMMLMKQFFDKQGGEAEREGARKALEAEEQQHNSPDELFLQKAIDCVKQHLDDADYDREQFASDMCVSSSTLYNKLRALTDQSVTGFINSIRLKEACRILRQRPDIKMTELSMEVGFNTPKYFAKLFKKEFGMLPSEYLEKGEV